MKTLEKHVKPRVGAILALAVLMTAAVVRAPSASAQSETSSLNAARAGYTATLRANGKIAFTSDRDGNREIYVMNADGTNQFRLTNNSVFDDSPAWSPDGTKIAFVSQKQDGSFAIYLMSADGTGRTEVTALGDPIWAKWRPLSWSPDGGKIAFHDASAVSGGIDIFVVNVDGSGRQNLTPDHAHLDLAPVWSPDGSKILFSRYDMYEVYGGTMLHTINPDGTNLTRLQNGFADGWNEDFAAWSPAGDKIVYSVNRWDFVLDLYIANPDGTGRQFFHGCDWTDNSCRLDALTPAFSPDGTKIAFSMIDFVNGTPQKLYVKNLDGTGLTLLTDSGASPSWQPLAPAACPNPIDCADLFVRQHYRDFLGREPDDEGLQFWTNEINSCGGDAQCREVKRVNVSAAFFLSIEFQNTGYLVERMYKVAYGDATEGSTGLIVPTIRRSEFMADTPLISAGVVVGQGSWEATLENNKTSYAQTFVRRQRFTDIYGPLDAAQFVDRLNQNAGGVLSDTERTNLINEASAGTDAARASVLRQVAENVELDRREKNRAFVLMQYFGYLRRNPNDAPERDLNYAGWNYWLRKLDQFDGDAIAAEMVNSFLVSTEYRSRFIQ